jgi:uncharacterized Zn-binding protein involved in type VI secretion
MPEVARKGDIIKHGDEVVGTIQEGSDNVEAQGGDVARVGDTVVCKYHQQQEIATGSESVITNGRRTARIGDVCTCGAVIATGAETVLAGG